METLIESTRDFEPDLDGLSEFDRSTIVEKINECISLFTTQQFDIDHQFHQPRLSLGLQGYDSSLYTFPVLSTLSLFRLQHRKTMVLMTVVQDLR
jgi:hypothetical protein